MPTRACRSTLLRGGLICKQVLQQRQELAAVGLDIVGERAGRVAVTIDQVFVEIPGRRLRVGRNGRRARCDDRRDRDAREKRGDGWSYSDEL